eukprot:scaffold118707_cov63-Phaeocystis_antarctica.AAC.4
MGTRVAQLVGVLAMEPVEEERAFEQFVLESVRVVPQAFLVHEVLRVRVVGPRRSWVALHANTGRICKGGEVAARNAHVPMVVAGPMREAARVVFAHDVGKHKVHLRLILQARRCCPRGGAQGVAPLKCARIARARVALVACPRRVARALRRHAARKEQQQQHAAYSRRVRLDEGRAATLGMLISYLYLSSLNKIKNLLPFHRTVPPPRRAIPPLATSRLPAASDASEGASTTRLVERALLVRARPQSSDVRREDAGAWLSQAAPSSSLRGRILRRCHARARRAIAQLSDALDVLTALHPGVARLELHLGSVELAVFSEQRARVRQHRGVRKPPSRKGARS